MPDKTIRVFDTLNSPLGSAGISFELYDVGSGVMVAKDLTRDLTGRGEWGVILPFAARSGPLEVYTTDPTYRYPGNVIRHLEGKSQNEIWIVLLALPTGPAGHAAAPGPATPRALAGWIAHAPNWTPEEKRAVWNLVLNYMTVVVPRLDSPDGLKGLDHVARNWRMALERLGFARELFEA